MRDTVYFTLPNYAQYVAVLQAQIIDLKKEIDELKNIKTK